MDAPELDLEKQRSTIQEMFAGVASRYDLLNHLLSGYQDVRWRNAAARSVAGSVNGHHALDLCCGTGDQAIALRKRGARVVAADFCLPMLALAQDKYESIPDRRPTGLAGDALELPFADRQFAAVTVSFGLRNVADLDAALREIARVLADNGRIAVLEFAVPRNPILRAVYLFYFRRILPSIGRLISRRGSAYTYLPESVIDFSQRQEFLDRMAAAGFTQTEFKDLTAGVVCLYSGQRKTT